VNVSVWQTAEVDDEAELNIFCVTCGMAVSPRVALRHMEKCFNKVIVLSTAAVSDNVEILLTQFVFIA